MPNNNRAARRPATTPDRLRTHIADGVVRVSYLPEGTLRDTTLRVADLSTEIQTALACYGLARRLTAVATKAQSAEQAHAMIAAEIERLGAGRFGQRTGAKRRVSALAQAVAAIKALPIDSAEAFVATLTSTERAELLASPMVRGRMAAIASTGAEGVERNEQAARLLARADAQV